MNLPEISKQLLPLKSSKSLYRFEGIYVSATHMFWRSLCVSVYPSVSHAYRRTSRTFTTIVKFPFQVTTRNF